MRIQLNFISWAAAILLVLGLGSAARAQTDEGLLLNPWEGTQAVQAQADDWVFAQARMDRGNSLSFNEFESSGRVRLMQTYPINPSIGYSFIGLIPDDKLHQLPRQLTDMSVGFATPIGQFGDWFAAVGGAVGYAGEGPLSIASGYYGKGQLMIGRQFANKDALLLVLDYNGNRSFMPDVPIPAIEYKSHYNKDIDFVVGFPESDLTWRINQELTFKTDFYIPDMLDASLEYKLASHWSAYTEYSERVDGFHVRDLGEGDRLFFEEQRVELGVHWRPRPWADLTLAGGYAFGRDFATGFDDRNLTTRHNLADAPYIHVGVSFSF